MLEFGNSVYMIDIAAFDKAVTIGTRDDKKKPIVDVEKKTTVDGQGNITLIEVFEKTYGKNKEIDAVKYDLLKTFIEYLMDYDEPADDTLGIERALAKAPLGYKIIFNTLLHEGVLKEKDNEE
jgi:hypothetical protein